MKDSRTKTEPISLKEARQLLNDADLSYEKTAILLGVSFSHLAKVLGGFRESKSLMKKIEALCEEEVSA